MRKSAMALILAASALPAHGLEPGWHYSPLPGEGDRASLGCDRQADDQAFTCLAVRCEDDFSTGLYIHSSRYPDSLGRWELTIDKETFTVEAQAAAAPYSARIGGDVAALADRLALGGFVYIRHAEDNAAPFAAIDLAGSLQAMTEALYWCAPRMGPAERNASPGVVPHTDNGDKQ